MPLPYARAVASSSRLYSISSSNALDTLALLRGITVSSPRYNFLHNGSENLLAFSFDNSPPYPEPPYPEPPHRSVVSP